MRLSLLTTVAAAAVASTTALTFSHSQAGIATSVILGLSISRQSLVSAFALPQSLRLDSRHRNHNDDTEDNSDSTDDGQRGRNRDDGNGKGNGNGRNGNGTGNGDANRSRNGTADANRGNGNSGNAGSGGNNVDGVDSSASESNDDNPSFNGSSGGNNVDEVDTGAGAPVTPGEGADRTGSSGGNNVDGVLADGSQQDANGTATSTGDVPLTTGTENAVGRNSTSPGSGSNTGTGAGPGTLPAGFPPAVPGADFVAGENRRSLPNIPRSMLARRDFLVSRKIGRVARSKIPVSPKRDIYRDTYDV